MIVGLVAVVKQQRKKGNNSNRITKRNKSPLNLMGARAIFFTTATATAMTKPPPKTTTAMQVAGINCSAPQKSS
jgi:hypothetical protein